MPSPEEVAAALRESHRLLRDDKSTPRCAEAPAREPPLIVETQDDRWRRELEDFEHQREAERRREQRASERIHIKQANDLALEARVSGLEERLDAVETALASLDTLANGTTSFADAVTERLRQQEMLVTKLDATIETMRAVHAREVDALRDRLAMSEATAARESAVLTRELTNARNEIARLDDRKERARDRQQLAAVGDNVIEMLRGVREDLASK